MNVSCKRGGQESNSWKGVEKDWGFWEERESTTKGKPIMTHRYYYPHPSIFFLI